MLNTSSLKRNENNTNFNNMSTTSIINNGINKIEEKTGGNTIELYNNDIIKSFHSIENKIFSNVENKLENKLENDNTIKIENFNLSEITKKYSNSEFSKNIFNNNKQMLISVSKKTNQFSIFDENNKPIGHFTIFHLVKYLGDVYDVKQQFLKEIDSFQLQKAKELIKILIFKLKYNKKNKYTDIVLLNYSESGFMGDIELLIKLNNQLHKYQTKRLYTDLSNVDIENKIKIEQNIKKFIFMLLNYTLQLISKKSDELINKDTNKELKEKLVNYSIGIVYRINIFVQEQLKIINNQNKNIKESIELNIELKKDLSDKLDVLIESSQKRNTKRQHIIKYDTLDTSDIDATDSQIKRIIYEANI